MSFGFNLVFCFILLVDIKISSVYNVTINSNNSEYAKQVENFRKNSKPKYKITCTKCGMVTYRNRLNKNAKYKHAIDDGELLIEKLREI